MKEMDWMTFIQESSEACLSFECKDSIKEELEAFLIKMKQEMGIVSIKDGLYEKMKVKQYLQFYAEVTQHVSIYKEAIEWMQLQDLLHVKTEQLTPSQKLRVSFAREMIHDAPFLFLDEPLRFLEEADIHLALHWIEHMIKCQKRIIITAHSLKDVCMMPGDHYLIDAQKNLQRIENLTNQEDITQPMKLSAKLDDKILLFNPNEIDYIESMDSKTYLYVRNSQFQSSMTMDELDQKLKRFGFYRSHRSYLVNMQKVTEIIKWTRNSYSLKLEGLEDTRIPLSKGRVEEMKDLYDF